MELLKLIGIVIVVVGFALKLDSILVITIAAVATALVSGMDPLTFFQTLGDSFVSNRSMLIFIIATMVTIVLYIALDRIYARQSAKASGPGVDASAGFLKSCVTLKALTACSIRANFLPLPTISSTTPLWTCLCTSRLPKHKQRCGAPSMRARSYEGG